MHFPLFQFFKKGIPRAFTLVELMVVLGIFAVLTSVVVYRYRDFNNNIILTNVAYEIGLLVRQAQVYGVSVKNAGGDTGFKNGYGVLFDVNTNTVLTLCSDVDGNKQCASSGDTTVDTLRLPAGYTIFKLETKQSETLLASKNKVSIVFVRPEPSAYIADDTPSAGALNPITEANITIMSPSGKTKKVVVWHTGQISVK